jgi:hypothetical protein
MVPGLGSRDAFGLTYDPGRNTVLLFGGIQAATPKTLAPTDVWEWMGATGTWSSRTPTPLPLQWPGTRIYPNFSFDISREVAVLFGGLQYSGVPDADTWEWNGATGAWTEKPAGTTNPPAVQETLMTYDAGRGRTVLFINNNNNDGIAVWEWNGQTWSDVTPVSGAAPDANSRQGTAYDPITQRVLVFGGANSPADRQLWAWQGP